MWPRPSYWQQRPADAQQRPADYLSPAGYSPARQPLAAAAPAAQQRRPSDYLSPAGYTAPVNRDRPAAAPPSSAATPFLVIKGYRVGSQWFEELFNAQPGCSFVFEYEHCLQRLRPTAGSALAPPNLTAAHLRTACGSCTAQAPQTQRCLACGRLDRTRLVAVAPPPRGTACVATGVSFGTLFGPTWAHLMGVSQLMPQLPIVVDQLVEKAASFEDGA